MKHVPAQVPATAVGFSTADCFMRLFDALGLATILVGEGRRIVRISPLAEQNLGSGLKVRAGAPAATDPASDEVLQAILSAHLSGETGGRDALGLHRRERRPLILRVVSLAPDMQAAFGGARLVAVLVDPEVCLEPSQALLHQVFGLTRKEALVATKLMCGATVQDMARDAGVGVGTVRAQIKAVFAKTETKRQAELVGLLTRLASISYEGH